MVKKLFTLRVSSHVNKEKRLVYFVCLSRGRRKEKDLPATTGGCSEEDRKLYLQKDYLRQRVVDVDFSKLVELPPSLDFNEWLATHGKLLCATVSGASPC